MAEEAHPRTLFHLVPTNDAARVALHHPDNRRFVSPAPNEKREPAFEVGFHVSRVPGRVMARLGRDTDLILQGDTVSAVHVSLEIHPETLVVLLSTRAKDASLVTIKPVCNRRKGKANRDNTIQGDDTIQGEDTIQGDDAIQGDDTTEGDDTIQGDCVLGYGIQYNIRIVDYCFDLIWREMVPAALRELAIQEYNKAMEQQAGVRSRYLPTKVNSETHTWYNTRIHTAQRPLFVEAKWIPRVWIGGGTFGKVYRVIDGLTGNTFAVKTINLQAYSDPEDARSSARREVKALQRLKHVCLFLSVPSRRPLCTH